MTEMTPEDYAELIRLREEIKGPDGFATWADAAFHERRLRTELEDKLKTTQWLLEQALSRNDFLVNQLRDAFDAIGELQKAVLEQGKLNVATQSNR